MKDNIFFLSDASYCDNSKTAIIAVGTKIVKLSFNVNILILNLAKMLTSCYFYLKIQ